MSSDLWYGVIVPWRIFVRAMIGDHKPEEYAIIDTGLTPDQFRGLPEYETFLKDEEAFILSQLFEENDVIFLDKYIKVGPRMVASFIGDGKFIFVGIQATAQANIICRADSLDPPQETRRSVNEDIKKLRLDEFEVTTYFYHDQNGNTPLTDLRLCPEIKASLNRL